MKELVLDISHCDPDIDLATWKVRHNVWGVIVKAGGYENIGSGHPERFETRIYKDHIANVQALGLHLGAYFYDVSRDVDTAKKNADYFVSLLDKYGAKFDMPVYVDIEDVGQLGIGKRRLTDVIIAFIERVNSYGYTCGLYTGRCALHENMIASELEKYPLWIAEYSNACHTSIRHGMWQFGCMHINGDLAWGDVSGYRDVNWCYIDYPSIINNNSGGGLPKVKKLSYGMAAAEVMDHFIDHSAHGYSQPNRDGVGYESLELSDRTVVEFNGGDRDCSRLIQTCYVVIGVLPRGMHMWTGNERETLLANGFVQVSLDDLQRGDVLWRAGHTEMYMGDGIEGGARRSETHGIDGMTGDQDGGEIDRSKFVRSHWTSAYRCILKRPGEDDGQDSGSDGGQKEGETSKMMMCFVKFDGDGTENFFDGQYFHALRNPDEKKAVIDFYQKAFGVTISPNPINFGSKEAPYGARLVDAMLRGPQFATLEAFEAHPSLAKVVSDQIRATTCKTDNKSIAEAVKKAI